MKQIRFIITILIVVSALTVLNAQRNEIDSLENLLLQHTSKDTVRVNLLNETANKLFSINMKKTFEYTKESKILANKLNFKEGKAKSLFIIGNYWLIKSDFTKALSNYEESLRIYTELGAKLKVSNCLCNIGLVFQKKSNYHQALEYYHKSLKILEELDNKKNISYCLNNIGVVHKEQGNLTLALEYYEKALDIIKEIGDKYEILNSFINIGVIHKRQGNYQQALEYYKKSLNIATELNDKKGVSKNLHNIGEMYLLQNKFPQALDNLKKSLKIKEDIGNEELECSSLFVVGTVYLKTKDYSKALNYTMQSLYIAEKFEILNIQRAIHEQLSIIYAATKRYKQAYQEHILYHKLNDSIFNEKNIKKITSLELQYRFEKDKQKTELLQQKKDTVTANEIKYQKTIKNVFIALIFVIGLILILVYRLYLIKKKSNSLLHTKNKELIWQKNKISEQKSEIQTQADKLLKHKEQLEETVKQRTSELYTEKEKVEESEERFRAIAEQASEGITLADLNGNYVFINSAFCTMTGYSEAELLKMTVFDMLENHENVDINPKMFGVPSEFILKRKNNSIFPIQIIVNQIKIGSQKLLLGILTDISERKKAEIKIHKLSTAVEQSANIIVITDTDGNIEYTNPKFTEQTGYSADEISGKNPRILNSGIQTKEYYTEMWQAISAGKIWEGEFCNKTKQGVLYWEQVTISPIKDKTEKITNYLAIKEDITGRKQAEQELQRSESQLRQIIDLVPHYIFVKDITGKFEIANKATAEVFGTTVENLTGKMDAEFVATDEEMKHFRADDIEMINSGKTKFIPEEKITDSGNNIRYLQTTKVPFMFSATKKPSLLGVSVDITEYKKAQQELIRAKERAEESNQLKTEFLNNMSHEIRTPLNGILGFSQFLNSPDLTDIKRKQYINIIHNSSNQLLRIIDDILEISQLGTKQVKLYEKNICLNDLLLELFSNFDIKAKDNKTPLYLSKGLSDKESKILTDETKLHKILSNLLENALKFTSEGFIEFGYKIINNVIEIYVKDTGIGIKPESQKTIFDRFSQEEKELSNIVGGLGLGLSIAKENAELLDGKITLQSEKGNGSTFFVTIPYKPVNSNTANDNSNINKTKRIKKQDKYTILIAEDEEMNYLYIKILLEKLKFDFNLIILHAKHGKEAVEICKDNTKIDFVFMDLKMPIMTGFEATKLIKQLRPNLPVVAQTAYSTNDEKEQAFSAGCDDFISKPISKKTLSRIIDKYLTNKV